MKELTTSENPLTLALYILSLGNTLGLGYNSSRYSIIAVLSIKVYPSLFTNAGTTYIFMV